MENILQLRPIKPQVKSREQIEKESFLRSIFWQGEFGSGLPDWKTQAEFEEFMNEARAA